MDLVHYIKCTSLHMLYSAHTVSMKLDISLLSNGHVTCRRGRFSSSALLNVLTVRRDFPRHSVTLKGGTEVMSACVCVCVCKEHPK